jgi:hypothetical protein
MEAVLDLYEEPDDPDRPRVCLDEYPLALTAPTRASLPLAAGRVRREDYEYTRGGSCSLFAAYHPAGGWRTIQARARRTAQDFAWFIKELVDVHFPTATVLRLVLDNLNTHTLGALYETFPPQEARRIARRIEFHFTPVHGSWLNMVEGEWAILARQCLGRHLVDMATAQQEIDAWVSDRNAARATTNWQFTSTQAREKLQRIYPVTAPLNE